MAITETDVKEVAPELSAETTARVNRFIAVAESMISVAKWSSKYDTGLVFLTCHLITLANRQGVGGAITSQTTGDVTVSFSTARPDSDELLAQTSYGMLFKSIRDSLSRGPMVV